MAPSLLLDLIKNEFRRHVLLKFVDLGINLGSDADALGDGRHESDDLCHLMLRQKAYLQIEFRSLRFCRCHSVLAYEDERRKEYSFNRSYHCQDDERRIELPKAGDSSEIHNNPKAKYKQMQVDETHAPGKARYMVSEALLKSRVGFLACASRLQRLDVSFQDGAQTRGLGRGLCWSWNTAHLIS
jgi:hypothetical protein